MATLAFTRRGGGAPLVLLHGIGSSRRAWEPVMPALAERFDVVAVDLPGFGGSEPLPPDVEPVPAALAGRVAELLDELGITTPHVVGNSLGGWVALELASISPVASLTLLSPAGLWKDVSPRYCLVSLRASRWLAEHAGAPLSRLVNYRLGRALVLGQSHGRPAQLSPDYARDAIHALASCPGFSPTLQATARRCYLSGPTMTTPVTVAFGSRDLLLGRRRCRRLAELPPQTRVAELPGCGHLPMSDDPAAVAALITTSVARAQQQPPPPPPPQPPIGLAGHSPADDVSVSSQSLTSFGGG